MVFYWDYDDRLEASRQERGKAGAPTAQRAEARRSSSCGGEGGQGGAAGEGSGGGSEGGGSCRPVAAT